MTQPETHLSPPSANRRGILSWAVYDVANSAFATTVMAGFFPIFFGLYWNPDAPETTTTAQLAFANAAASILVALMAPMLGAMADRSSARKRFLLVFTALGVAMTCGLFLVPQGAVWAALGVYVLSLVGFSGGLVFYDALMMSVTEGKKADVVSAIGYSLGYLGGGVLFAVQVIMVLNPATVGLPDAETATRLAFLMTGIWWAVFAIPIFLFVEEMRTPDAVPLRRAAVEGFRQVRDTFAEIRAYKPVLMFLGAYFLYIDGVNTVMRMALKFGQDIGLETGTLIKALLLVQFIGFPMAFLFGKFGQKIGTRLGILVGVSAYGVATIMTLFMETATHFYMLAVLVGCVQGGVQALSRAFFARLAPADKAGEFFGFYNMLGKFATILGPILMMITGLLTQNPRLPIVSLLVLFVAGGLLLRRVPDPARQPQPV
jgi:MFS transporter, UMF1 family